MTSTAFENLGKGDTITFSQFEEIFKECGTATIKADNARGCKTVSVSDVKRGDKVNNGTRFIEVVAEVEDGDFYRCPQCGELITFDNNQYDGETLYTCQLCNAIFNEWELEAVPEPIQTIKNGDYVFEVVDEIPEGYRIWGVGKNMVDGWLPLCQLSKIQSFEGGRNIDVDTLKAVATPQAQTILKGASVLSSCNVEVLERFILKNNDNPMKQWEIGRISPIIPLIKQIPGYRRLAK